MHTDLKPGRYVAAVSGGVDSMTLLDLLVKQAKSNELRAMSQKTHSSKLTAQSSMNSYEFIVAHFDHGIRADSHLDKELVQATAKQYGLTFEYAEGKLGPKASEEAARKARYEFLHQVREKYGATAIITAHHQDDLIETALINMLRGTGRKGLTSLQSTDTIKRPLLGFTKKEIRAYAKKHGIKWREDETNADTAYLRNYIRKYLIPKLTDEQYKSLVKVLESAKATNNKVDAEIAKFLQSTDMTLPKKEFMALPYVVACEVMAAWLRQQGIRDFDKKTIERLVIAAKTLREGQRTDINNKNYLRIGKTTLEVSH